MKLARWAACLTVAAFLFGGCKKKEAPAEAQPSAQPNAAETAQPAAAAPAEAPKAEEAKSAAPAAVPHGDDPSLLHPARLKEQAPEKYQVRFDTTRGVFTVTVTRAWAPIGADRFYNLVKHHFFDNSASAPTRRFRRRGSTLKSRAIPLRKATSAAIFPSPPREQTLAPRRCSST